MTAARTDLKARVAALTAGKAHDVEVFTTPDKVMYIRLTVANEATEKELLELVRLGWFRRGSIPEVLRGELLAILAEHEALGRAARNAIAQELRLRSAEAPRSSFAAEILLVEAVAHDLAAHLFTGAAFLVVAHLALLMLAPPGSNGAKHQKGGKQG